MNREDGYRKQNDGRNTRERNEGASKESDANSKLGGDRDPGHEVRQRNTSCLKNAGEYLRAFGPFRETVRQKSITNNQSKQDRRVRRRLRARLPPSQHFRCETRHYFLRC